MKIERISYIFNFKFAPKSEKQDSIVLIFT